MTNSGSGPLAPTKSPMSLLWKQLGGNPKSMSTDSLTLPSPVEQDHRLSSEMGALHMPVLSSKEGSGDLSGGNRRLSNIWNAASSNSSEFKVYRDTFLSSRHGFTGRVFGVSLSESLSVASAEVIVQSELVSFGRIPVVVAKCGAYLKANGLETSGIFRIAGNSKRVKELQYIFSSPPDYGSKFNDWDAYTVHDVASLLRRYLNNLEEPLIPLDLYESFRKPLRDRPRILRHMAKQIVSSPTAGKENTILLRRPSTVTDKDDRDNDGDEEKEDDDPSAVEERKKKSQRHRKRLIRDIKAAIKDYEDLFISISNDTKQLTIYLLDLLSLFARQAQFNLMSGRNLAAIFQPSILSHPDHDMDPREYELSRLVTEFLIEYSYKLLPHLLKLTKDEQQEFKRLQTDDAKLEAPKPRKLVVTNENDESVTVPSEALDNPGLRSNAAQDCQPSATTDQSLTTTFDSPTKSSVKQPLKVPKKMRPHSRSIGSAPVPPDVIASSRRRSRLFPWLPKPGILSDNGGDFTATEEDGEESYFDDENRDAVVYSPVSALSNSLPRQHLHIPPMNRSFSGNSTNSSLNRRPMSAIFSNSRNGSMDALDTSSVNQGNETVSNNKGLLEENEGEERSTRSRKRDSWFQRLRSRSRSNTRS